MACVLGRRRPMESKLNGIVGRSLSHNAMSVHLMFSMLTYIHFILFIYLSSLMLLVLCAYDMASSLVIFIYLFIY